LPTSLPIFFKTAAESVTQPRMQLGLKRCVIHVARQNRCEDIRNEFSLEWLSRSQHFIEHAAKRPDIRAVIDRDSPRLLRRHVRGRPEYHSAHRAAQHCWGIR